MRFKYVFKSKALRQKIGYNKNKRTYVIPLLASLVMGAIVLGVYYGLFTLYS